MELLNLRYVDVVESLQQPWSIMLGYGECIGFDGKLRPSKPGFREHDSLLWGLTEARIFVFGDLFGTVGESRDENCTWRDFHAPFETCWFEGKSVRLSGLSGGEKICGVLLRDYSPNTLRQFAFRAKKGEQLYTVVYAEDDAKQTAMKRVEKSGGTILPAPDRQVDIRLFFERQDRLDGKPVRVFDHYWMTSSLETGADPDTPVIPRVLQGPGDGPVCFSFVRNLVSFLDTHDVEIAHSPHGSWRSTEPTKPKEIEKWKKRTRKFPPFYRVKLVGKLRRLYESGQETGRKLAGARWICGHFKRYRYCAECGSVNAMLRVLRGEGCKKCDGSLSGSVTKKRWCPPFVQGPGDVTKPVIEVRQ